MYKIIAGEKEFEVAFDDAGKPVGTINGEPFSLDLLQDGQNFSIVWKNKVFNARLNKSDFEEKQFSITVNNNTYELGAKTRMDLLLESMGLADLAASKISEVKAPMPGLVIRLESQPGDEIAKGDPLLVLEAMKMENVLKSPTDGVIKEIKVSQGQAVEKNEILITFE